ncbi:hypothetical protein Syun_009261 [Stephania yunnanensis]|uniref:Uncharacterized protein n=1 Tax=Stephania yunnanensis TaxID=152371 RepID=A0AAP0PNW0_9MAGN
MISHDDGDRTLELPVLSNPSIVKSNIKLGVFSNSVIQLIVRAEQIVATVDSIFVDSNFTTCIVAESFQSVRSRVIQRVTNCRQTRTTRSIRSSGVQDVDFKTSGNTSFWEDDHTVGESRRSHKARARCFVLSWYPTTSVMCGYSMVQVSTHCFLECTHKMLFVGMVFHVDGKGTYVQIDCNLVALEVFAEMFLTNWWVCGTFWGVDGSVSLVLLLRANLQSDFSHLCATWLLLILACCLDYTLSGYLLLLALVAICGVQRVFDEKALMDIEPRNAFFEILLSYFLGFWLPTLAHAILYELHRRFILGFSKPCVANTNLNFILMGTHGDVLSTSAFYCISWVKGLTLSFDIMSEHLLVPPSAPRLI